MLSNVINLTPQHGAFFMSVSSTFATNKVEAERIADLLRKAQRLAQILRVDVALTIDLKLMRLAEVNLEEIAEIVRSPRDYEYQDQIRGYKRS